MREAIIATGRRQFLRIALVGDRPQELVTLVDAIREVYVKEFFEKDQLDRSERLTALAPQPLSPRVQLDCSVPGPFRNLLWRAAPDPEPPAARAHCQASLRRERARSGPQSRA